MHPLTQTAGVVLHPKKHRSSSVDEHPSQIGIAALADAEQPGFAARGILARHQAEPCREVASIAESRSVADGSYHCRRDQWPDSGDLAQALARPIFLRDVLNLLADV